MRGDTIPNYFRALLAELGRLNEFGWSEGQQVSSIYVGGGTPSVAETDDIARILERITSLFSVAPKAEISLEINPEDVTPGKAKAWKALGINRASLGVESLKDDELARLERRHDSLTAISSYRGLRDAGFENISVDLLWGLENQDPLNWHRTLESVIAWKPEHVSAYGLTIEEKTRYAKEQRLGKLSVPSEELQTEFFLSTAGTLAEAGYRRYEISNFARPGFESCHNLLYWTGGEYWGVGVSAHSFQKHRGAFSRWWNPRDLRKYVRTLLASSDLPRESETLTPQIHWGERLMTGLRLTEGVSLTALETDIGVPLPEPAMAQLLRFSASGHIRRDHDRFALTNPGFLVSNEIFRALLARAES